MSEAFDNWYETYDRDGGELMLFNTIDLEATWKARQPEIDKLKSEKDILFNTLEMILSENSNMRWQRAAINAIKEVQG